ncbi:proto-oncogene tyrosine-protein kinase receptor Ret-like [Limulus polyphemus]|uniref:Proto-oncogene tyrosine-protein kinase receptor Ret-like n=1 Tax=Limulus polyphemus TaxID=6850 RepID=A0ABM1SAC8_LIMPO|nr:proto-oncogene tyrosine-protein kinase receptor Ret-like [Limulus polyphemus]
MVKAASVHVSSSLLTIITNLLLGWQVSSLIIPHKNVDVTIPLNYPDHVPFYQLRCVQEDGSAVSYGEVMYRIRKVYVEGGGSRVDGFFIANSSSGQLALAAPFQHRWIQPDTMFSLRVKASIRLNSEIISSSAVINVHISDIRDPCRPRLELCFYSSNMKFELPESTAASTSFGQLRPISTSFLCPEIQTAYEMEKGQDLVNIHNTQGSLQLLSSLDAEKRTTEVVDVGCYIKDSRGHPLHTNAFSLSITIRVIDVNDNAPYLPADVSTILELYDTDLQLGQDLPIQFNAFDKDSATVNNIVARVEQDHLGLFRVRNTTFYDNIMDGGMLFISFVETVKPIQFPDKEYCFVVILEDKTLTTRATSKVIYNVIIRKHVDGSSQMSVVSKGVSSASISRQATLHARVTQPVVVSVSDRWFFAMSSVNQNVFDVTPRTGIIYVANEKELQQTSASNIRLNLSWANDTEERGYLTIIVNLTDEVILKDNRQCDNICASSEDKEYCEGSCGPGTVRGRCSWRPEVNSTSFISTEYATCSANLKTCPDGDCDELETLDNSLCPQDCVKQENVQGEAITHDKGIGIHRAIGTCTCITYDSCYCLRSDHLTNNKSKQEINDIFHTSAKNIEDETTTFNSNFRTDEVFKKKEPVTSCDEGCMLVICLVVICGFGVCVVIFVFRRLRQTANRKKIHKYIGSPMSLAAETTDYSDERPVYDSQTNSDTSNTNKTMYDTKWEFPRENLIFEETLGEGEFGKVMKANAWNLISDQQYTTVAVKMLKGNGKISEEQALLTEFNVLKEISHPNVIRLLGACTQKGGPLYLIVEYADLGSLRSYLWKRRHLNLDYSPQVGNPIYLSDDGDITQPDMTPRELLSFAWQIANGMSYLSDMKLIHRDLATRNLLLAKGKIVKISDFGLSRDVYEGETYLKRSTGRVPVKWMAIESLEDNLYTSKSDVWSFGVVLWEISTLGATPYPGVTPERLFHLLKSGYRMNKPNACSDELYSIMLMCWKENPHERPSFKHLVKKLDQMLLETMEYLELKLGPDTDSLNWTEGDHSSVISDSSEEESDGAVIEYGKLTLCPPENLA